MIRPVEVQGVIQRVQDITQLKQNEDNKSYVQQANINSQLSKEQRLEHENVIKKDNAEYHQQKFDAKEKGSNEYSGSKKRRDHKNTDSDGKVIAKRKGCFDVKI